MQGDNTLNRSFIKNIAVLMAVNLLVKPAYIFLIDAQVQSRVGENEYGLFFSIFNYCMLFQVILDPGIFNYNSQLIAKSPNDVSSHFSKIAGAKILLVAIYAVLVFAFSWPIGFGERHYSLLPGIMCIFILISFSQYLRSHFAALGQYHYEAWYSGLDKFLMVLIIGFMLYINRAINIELFILGQIAALVLACLCFIFLLKGRIQLSVQFSIKELKVIIKKTLPYAFVLLFMTLFTRMDGLMLERLLDDSAYSAGVYARAYRLLDAANMTGILFAGLMLPMFAQLMNDTDRLSSLVEEATRMLFYIALLVCLCCWYYSDEIMDLVYGQNTQEHYTVFKYLMTGFFAMSLANVFGCLFLASEKLKELNRLFVFGIFLNFSLNMLLIPRYGAIGAALTTIATQYVVFMGQLLLAFKDFRIKYSIQTLSGMAILIFFGFVLFKLAALNVSLNWIVEIIIIMIFMIFLAYLCGFLRLSLFFKRSK